MTRHNPKNIVRDWEEHYKGTPMEKLHWYSEKADTEVEQALGKYPPSIKKDVLDIGTGPGTMAIELTKMGYNVTASDISASAIDMAKKRADKLAAKIKFVVDDIRDSKLKQKYDIIHDRGCFHVMGKTDIPKYLENVHNLLKKDGALLLKTFSKKELREDGPNKYSPELIKEIFSEKFEFLHCEETEYPSTLPVNPKAIFCILKKK